MNDTKKKNSWFDTIRFIVIALIIIIPFRMFVAEPFIVNGQSMDPTFVENEYLIIDRLSYRLEKPQRGDVVVFKYPNNPKIYYIKRIIGLPGETLYMKDGSVHIETSSSTTVVLNDTFISNKDKSTYPTVTLTSDQYFVLGDNRPVSSDSRSWGPLEEKFIVGTPFISLFPFNKIDIYPGAYQFKD